MACMTGVPGPDGRSGPVLFGRSARKAALLSGSAVALTFLASAAQAQCTSASFSGGGNIRAFDFGITSSGTVSAVQSLIAVLNTSNTAFLTQNSAFIAAPPNPQPYQQGGGVWVRGTGGTVETRTPATFAFSGNAFDPAGGVGTCDTRTSQRYGGVQAGADIARLNIDGANVHVGATAGYTESRITSPTGPGVFSGDFQIPFAGIYAAVTKGGFFADAQIRTDFYQSRLSDQSNGLFEQGLNARSFSITGNVGNQFPLGDDWFVEPSAGVVYSRVEVDPINLSGTLILANNPGLAPPSRVNVNDFDSILGRASVRVGRNFLLDGFAIQPFFTASVFNEFAGKVRTNINTTFAEAFSTPELAALDTSAELLSERIGTYGQFALGIAGQILNTGWLGYVRGDYRIGDRVEGVGISGGVRYQFTPEQLLRTDIVRKGADPSPDVAAVPRLVNWTGFSIGGSLGGLRDESEQNLDFGAGGGNRVRVEAAGILAGGQVGYDYQFGSIVVGVAGDFAYTNATGAKACPGETIRVFFTCETKTDFLAMGTGRLGYASERALYYVKGGAAFAPNMRERVKSNTGSELLLTGSTFPTITSSDYDAVGWTIGAGVEFALTQNWSAKAEYMHYELERQRLPLPEDGTASFAQHSGDLVRVGVNYRFAFEAPPAAAVAPARPIVRKF